MIYLILGVIGLLIVFGGMFAVFSSDYGIWEAIKFFTFVIVLAVFATVSTGSLLMGFKEVSGG